MQQIPLAAEPSQQLSITLDNQACAINVYTLGAKLYMDLAFNGTNVINTRPCLYGNLMLQDAGYYGFAGDFTWVDTNAGPTVPPTDPVFSGLGTRYQLIYLETSDLS